MEYSYTEEKGKAGCGWGLCTTRSLGRREVQETENPTREAYLTFDQPLPISPPKFEAQIPPNPITTITQNSRTTSWSRNDAAFQYRRSRASSFSTLKRSLTPQSRSRPSIGAPTNFRRVVAEPMPARRRSFRPLELSIYVEDTGRLSPLPDFSSDSWELKGPQLTKPPAVMLRRETVDNSQLHGEYTFPRKPISTYSPYNSRREVVSEPFLLASENGPGPALDHRIIENEIMVPDLETIDEGRTPTLLAPQIEDMLPATRPWSQRSSGHSMTRIQSPSPFTRHARSDSGSKSSKSSMRRSKNDTVEEAIRELNAIVEERRIQANLAKLGAFGALTPVPLSPTSHRPLIAPTMAVRVRSETLSDIGSAFSASVTKSSPAAPKPLNSSLTALPTMPLMAQTPPIPVKSPARRSLSSWLRSSIPPSPASKAPQKFYQLPQANEVVSSPIQHTRSSGSFSTMSTVTSIVTPRSSASIDGYATPTTTVTGTMSPTTPLYELPRSSMSKTPKHLRRAIKRGLSIDTTLSNGSTLTVPPIYHELDPHPIPSQGQLTPSRIGVAC